MSFTVRVRRSSQRRIGGWNLPDRVLMDVYIHLTEHLGQNPTGLLHRVTVPFDGMAYSFSAVDPSNRVYGYVFTFHIRYGADEQTLWVGAGSYERFSL